MRCTAMVWYLCAAVSFLRHYRWPLTFAVAASVLGYLAGMCFCGSLAPYPGAGPSTSAVAPPSSAEYWRQIQKKIDEMAGDIRDLQSYVNTGRRIFRVTNSGEST